MNTIRKVIQSDDEGTLHVDLPVGAKRISVEMVITWQELSRRTIWPENWFEKTAGSISDNTFFRSAQGSLEPRVDFE
jgi:hypothetical protein